MTTSVLVRFFFLSQKVISVISVSWKNPIYGGQSHGPICWVVCLT